MKDSIPINPSLLSLEEIVQASPVPTFVLDAQHRIVHWNRACEQILKVPASDMLGSCDQWKPFYPSERPVMADLVISGDIENRIGDYYEGKYRRSDVVPGSYEAEDFFPEIGDGVWLYFSASPIHDDQGQVIGAIETLQDITLRNNAVLSEQKALEKLRLSHDRLRTVIEHFPFAVVVFNQQAELMYYNSRFTQLVELPPELISREGVTLEQIYQHNLERGEYVSEETLHQAEALMSHVKQRQTMSMERTRPNGTVLDIRGTPIPDGYVISFTDITARKGIEHRIQQLLLEFQLIFQYAQVGIARLRDRKILTCNPKLAEILGYDNPDELIGQSTEILYPDHQSWVDDGKRLYPEVQLSQRIEQEVSYQRKNGSTVNVMRAGQLIEHGDKYDSIWTFMDISDRLEAESALAMKHQELQSVLDAAHEVSVIATTVKGTITLFNRGAEQMLGYRADEVVGIETPMLIHVEEEVNKRRHELEQELGKPLTPFETFVYKARLEGAETRDWHYVRKDGRRLAVSLVVTSVRSPAGQIVGYLGLARDITEQREAEAALIRLNNELELRVAERTVDLEQALEKVKQTQTELARADRMAALGSLVAGVSHELNTPIGNCVTVSDPRYLRQDQQR
ncbi:PAS domain S-box protein [Motiliproteus sp.]|uniref:PAS domain S-box protein n=1 Tax=Motiliproteus sp. TaxID=1898955 RepID=UPI003BACA404